MGFRAFVGTIVVVAAGAAVFGAYAPEAVEKMSPAAGQYAHQLHDWVALRTQRSASPVQAQAVLLPLVSAAVAKRSDYPLYLEGLGQVQAFNTVTVRTRVDGQVMKIAFEEGQMVKAGDLLAQIDPRPFQAALDQAKAKQSQDEANLANAKLDQQRYATLAKQNFASQQQLDTQNALVAQLTAQIAADAASIEAAQVQLDYTTIRAPISGRTGFRLVDEGNIVAASQQTGIVVIAELQPISVMFTAPEEQVGEINDLMRAGKAKVVAKSTDGVALATGVLEVVDNQID